MKMCKLTVSCIPRIARRALQWQVASIRRSWVAVLLLTAMQTTLLTTLICIAHCYLIVQPAATTVIVDAASEGAFFCHIPGDSTTSTLPLVDAGTLRALQQAAPTHERPSLPPLLCLARQPHDTHHMTALVYLAPEPPPPRQPAA